jgi:hypothetical protein
MTASNPFAQLDMFGTPPTPAEPTAGLKMTQAEPLKPATTTQTGLAFGQKPPTNVKSTDKKEKTKRSGARTTTALPPAPTRQITDAPALLRSSVLLAFLRSCTGHAEELHQQLVELEGVAPPEAIDHHRLANDARAFIVSPGLRAAIGLRALDLLVEQGGTIDITEPEPPAPAPSTTNIASAHPSSAAAQPGDGPTMGDDQVLASATPFATPKVQHDENAWYRKTDRHQPVVSRVLLIGDQKQPYVPPSFEFRSVEYGTPFTIRVGAGNGANTPAKSIQQHMAYCVPTQETEQQLLAARTAFADALGALAGELRAAGSYEAALGAAGGATKHPRPLTTTAITCEDPDHRTYYWTNWRIPQPERKAVKRHTPKMVQLGDTTGLRMLGGVFCCADDATWERIQTAHAHVAKTRDHLLELLRQMGTYEAALADSRYSDPNDSQPLWGAAA